jgi:hypothetical protein
MAIGVTKAHGNSAGVNLVGSGQSFANAAIINTGIATPIAAYKIAALGITANLAAELGEPSPAGLVGAVETLLKVVSTNATVLAYQVDTSGSTSQLSVIVERSGWDTDTSLQTAIRALSPVGSSGNIGAYGNVCPSSATVSSAGGIKLA